jgi:NAD(P)-dependent dehydrogenase (short-subunit alcohol dehydrogenase family)
MNAVRRVAVVTGADRGLGLETCRQLGRLGIRVVLTARDAAGGEAAAAALRNEGLDVGFQPLDVRDGGQIAALARHIESEHGRVDILVNNAGVIGVPFDRPSWTSIGALDTPLDTIRATIEINALGALRMIQALVPLMRGSGRVVNVSSGMGQLADMRGGFADYRLSKVMMNALTRIVAFELRGTGVKVNSVCPGWVRTYLGGEKAPRSPAEGATGIVWAATLPADGPSGGFFRDGKPIRW